MDPYRRRADDTDPRRAPPRRPGWRDFVDVLVGLSAAIAVALVIVAIALFR